MHSPHLSGTGYDHRPSRRSTASAVLLSLGIMALIVLALMQLGIGQMGRDSPGGQLTAIQLSADKSQDKQKSRKAEASKPKQAVIALPQTVPTPVPTPPPFKIVKLSKKEFAAWDITGMSKQPAENAGVGDESQSAGAVYGPGSGPGGARLYKAEWYREPSDAEIGGYLKAGAPLGSWAMIACQTIDRYRVENCRELDESPRGSGLARAMRQAAWQFLIRPPRLGGKPIPGAWVSIRITFSKSKSENAAAQVPETEG